MSLLAERAGQVVVRVGGNTQDYATLVANTSDGRILEKESIDPNNPVSLGIHSPLTIYSIVPNADGYAYACLHGRPLVHDVEHLNLRKRQVVPRYGVSCRVESRFSDDLMRRCPLQ